MYRRVTTWQPPPSSSSSSISTSMAETASAADKQKWKDIQFSLRKKLITEDDFRWKLPSPTNRSSVVAGGGGVKEEFLKYVGGVDVSYSKEDPSVACGTIVVLDIQTLQVVYDDYSIVTPEVPYVAGFLAFREFPILNDLLEKMKKERSPFYPQIVMVDGNGLLHPRGFGSACHLGVLANIPTIGVGKNLHYVDGLTENGVEQLLEAEGNGREDFFPLKGRSGRIWGAAMRPTKRTSKPIFISIGHRVSLETAIKIAEMTCKYRVPEPIRQADLISRDHIKRHEKGLSSLASSSGQDRGRGKGTNTSQLELNDLVAGMSRMKMHSSDEQHGQHGGQQSSGYGLYSGSSQKQGQNRWTVQSGWMGSGGQNSGGSYFRREIGSCFECGEKGHFKRDCPELQR